MRIETKFPPPENYERAKEISEDASLPSERKERIIDKLLTPLFILHDDKSE